MDEKTSASNTGKRDSPTASDIDQVTKKVSKKLKTAKRQLTESFKSSAALKQKYKDKLKNNRSKEKRSHARPVTVATSLENLSKDEKPMHKESTETRLKNLCKDVSVAMMYFEAIVKKNCVEQYSGSATKVMEAAMVLIEKLDKVVSTDQSNMLASCRSRVVQYLAKLVHWADMMLIKSGPPPELQDVSSVIDTLQKGVEEFVDEAIEKIKTSNNLPHTPSRSYSVERSRSTENVALSPPAKPPLPGDRVMSTPPLPPKKRNSMPKPVAFVSPNNHTADYSSSQTNLFGVEGLTHNNDFNFIPRQYSDKLRENDRHSYCSTLSSEPYDEGDHSSSMQDVGNLLQHHLPPSPRISLGDYESDYEDHIHEKLRHGSDVGQASVLPIRRRYSNLERRYNNFEHRYSRLSLQDSYRILSLSSLHGNDSFNSERSSSWSSLLHGSSEELIGVHNEDEISVSFGPTDDFSEHPPPLPVKQRHSLILSKHDSQYSTESLDTWSSQEDEPPPLPPKQNKIEAYMHFMNSNQSQPPPMDMLAKQTTQRYTRQREPNIYNNNKQQNMYQSPAHMTSYSNRDSITSITSTVSEQSSSSSGPPALPPKLKRNNSENTSVSVRSQRANSISSSSSGMSSETKESSAAPPPVPAKASLVPVLPDKNDIQAFKTRKSNKSKAEEPVIKNKELHELVDPGDLYDRMDVSEYLNYRKPTGGRSTDVEAGCVAALVVTAAEANNKDLLFYEAFLMTFRTYITPHNLLEKLLYRYNTFGQKAEENNNNTNDYKRAKRNAYFLILRIVDELCLADITEETLKLLMELVYQLLCDGSLQLASLLRHKVLKNFERKQAAVTDLLGKAVASITLNKDDHSILDFPSLRIAEQMSLLDLKLFQKIEIPEVLQWASEQSEEKCPNLTAFTGHFNNMSYWTRSVILKCDVKSQDREKLLNKFIRIMRHLRKMNNFNSYLAVLSALDSAPIRRLEWQKQTTDGLREYCQLIDSSSSFRTYREALSEASIPCIPYLGLILQDLTFIHLGNKDEHYPGVVNFSKRWQYFHILDSMRRFKLSDYEFKRDTTILNFFDNFREYESEEALWERSLQIKPRQPRRRPPPSNNDDDTNSLSKAGSTSTLDTTITTAS